MARGGLGTISIDLEARIAKFESDIGRAARLLEREMSRSARQSERAITEMRKTVEREMQSVRRTMEQTRTLIVSVFSFQLARQFAGEIRALNDGFINVQAQLRQTTSTQKQLTAATEETFKVAQRTYASFESTGLLVGRTARALQSAGRDQRVALQESLRFSEAINNAFILSGAKAIEAKNAILQLSQGLSSGTLRGDEYRSVAEQGSKVTQILAKNLTEVDGALELANGRMGITTGRLRELAYEGKLTTDLVVAGMLAGFNELALGVGDIPLTIERAFVQLRNAAENYIGTSQGIASFNRNIAESVAFLAENFRVMADAALAAATALLIMLAGRGVGAVGAFITNMRNVAAARRADAAAALEQARAAELAARQQMAQNASSRAAAQAVAQGIQARIAEAQAAREVIRAQTAQALSTARLSEALNRPDGYLAAMMRKGDLDRRDAQLAQYVIAQNQKLGAQRAEIVRQNALYATSQRDVAQASSRSTEALKALQKQAATAVATLGRLGAGFLSLIGGWPTLILGAVYGLYELYAWTKRVDEERTKEANTLKEYTERLRERVALEEELRKYANIPEEEREALTQIAKAQEEINGLMAERAKVEAQIAALQNEPTAMYGAQQKQLEDLNNKIGMAKDTLKEFQIAAADAGMIIEGSFEPVLVTANNMADAFAALTGQARQLEAVLMDGALFSKEGSKYLDDLNEEIATMGMSKDMLVVYRASRIAANEADEDARNLIIERALKLAEMTREQDKSNDSVKRVVDVERQREKAMRDAVRAQKEREKALKAEAAALRSLDMMFAKYTGVLSGPMIRALEENERLQEEFNKELEVLLKVGPPTEATYLAIADAMGAVAHQQEKNIRLAEEEEDIRGKTLKALDEEIKMLRMSERDRKIYETMQQAINEAKQQEIDIGPAQLQMLRNEVAARIDAMAAIEQQMEQQQIYRDIMIQGAEDVANAFAEFVVESEVKFDDFADEMVNIAKNMVKRMIAEFIKLQFINPMMNMMFGMNLPTGGGGGAMGVMGAAAVAMGGSGSNGGLNAQNAISLARAGGYTGTAMNLLAAPVGGVYNSMMAGEFASGFVGPPQYMANTGTAGLGNASAGGILGGVAGAYYGAQNRNSTGARVAAGASYGALGFAAGTGITAGLAAGSASAGVAAGAGAFSSLGAATWIPVVGWILAIAALVDLFSGGKLFGTSFRPESATSTLSLSPEGASASTSLREVRQRSLFRGRQWRDREVQPGEEAIEAASQFWMTIDKVMTDYAAQIGGEAPEMITAALRTVQEFDKKGRVTATKYFVDILGRSWEAATVEEGATRIAAEAIIKTIDGILGPAEMQASQIAERWRDNVEELAEGAQFLVMLAADINRGFGLLGDGSLLDVFELVEDMQKEGEALADTYARIYGATRLLEDALSLSNVTLDGTREEFVRFATEIAEAAGGLDRATQLWQSYFNTFFTAAERAEMQVSRSRGLVMTSAEGLGLNGEALLGEGGAQMFRSAFTEALPTLTPAQVVLWLELGDYLAQAYAAQAQYNEALQGTTETLDQLLPAMQSYAEFVMQLQEELSSMDRSDFVNEIAGIGGELRENIDQLQELAEAAGMAAPRVEDLAVATELAARKVARAIAALEESTAELAVGLYGTPLSRLEAEISAMEEASRNASTGVRAATDAVTRFVDNTRRAVEDLLLDDSLSPLNDREKLQLAMDRLRGSGSEQDARQVLTIGRRLMASGADYERLFREVTSLVREVEAIDTPGSAGGGGVQVSAELQALYDRREQLLAEQEAENRRRMALELAQNVADLAGIQELSFEEVLGRYNVTMEQLATDLGMSTDELVAYLESLQSSTYSFQEFADEYQRGVDRIVAAIIGDRNKPNTVTPEVENSLAWRTGPGEFGPNRGLMTAEYGSFFTSREDSMMSVPSPRPDPIGDMEDSNEDVREAIDGLRSTMEEILTSIASSTGNTAASLERIAVASDSRLLNGIADSPRTSLMAKGREIVR